MHRNEPAGVLEMARLSFQQACDQYPHRFTCTHVPRWALDRRPDGSFYAPQFRDCREWYENTKFPGEPGHIDYPRKVKYCYTTGQTWPVGQSLKAPFRSI